MGFFTWPKSKKRMSIAVVGIPASGKSYLLSDIVTSFQNMGLSMETLTRNGVTYESFNQYKANITKSGKVAQTELYALRPTENIFGAILSDASTKFEADFADIPGEVFSGDIREEHTRMDVYLKYSQKLQDDNASNFYVTEWKNDGGQVLKIVEPIFNGDREKKHNAKKQMTPGFNIELFRMNRKNKFQNWENTFSWLLSSGYTEKTGSREKVSGKKIMKNFQQYQPDTLMYSLAEKLTDICPNLNITTTTFINVFMEPFYFLHYCMNATDIVICDKLLVPQGVSTEDQALISYNILVQNLSEFVKGKDKAKVYLAFRGVDFMLQEKCEHYKNLCHKLRMAGYKDDAILNIVYSLFAYIMWSRVSPEINSIPANELDQFIGLTKQKVFSGIDIKDLEKKFIDYNCGSGYASSQTVEGQDEISALLDIINPHIGANMGNMFRNLLNVAYGYKGADATQPMRMMPPHVYFTCTPVTAEFDIYKNDPASSYQRFIHEQRGGAMRYFDTAGSHFCFGTYQLCLDILSQHGVDIIDLSDIGELLNISQCTN